MTSRRNKLFLCFVIIQGIAMLAACGKKSVTEPEITETHERGNPLPTDFVKEYYDDITEIKYWEMFGPYESFNRFYVDVSITNKKITYTYYEKYPTEEEKTDTSWEKPFNEQNWNKMKELLMKYQVGMWEDQYAYQNLSYRHQPSNYIENRNAEYRTQGKVFNVTSPFRYLGMDEKEKLYRSRYEGTIFVGMDETYGRLGESRTYDGYGIPPGYNQFADELWDLVIGYTGGTDWREKLDDAGMNQMRLMYPYMQPDETSEGQIRYFSLLESYGGKDDAVPVLFVYDGGNPSFAYECLKSQKTYSVNEEGQPVLYCGDPRFSAYLSEMKGRSFAYIQDGDPGVDVLETLLDSYGVSEWGDKTSDADFDYVEQGEFYSAKNAEEVSDENQKYLRERYDALIHLIYSDGVHKEIRLENGKLPETYNQFRKELWDYFIPHIYQKEYQNVKELYEQKRDGGEEYPHYDAYFIQKYMEEDVLYGYPRIEDIGWEAYLEQEDWRNHIDEWGKGYMLQKYPYMAPAPEQGEE